MNRQHKRIPLVIAASVLLTGCAGAAESMDEVPDDPAATATAAPGAPTVRDYDFGAADWLFSPGGTEPAELVSLAGGAASVETFQYELGEAVFADADGDGRDDAVVPISRSDGNGFETVWYIWLDSGDGISQVPYPIAHQSRCGTAVESITAGNGGFVVQELLRLTGTDDTVPCSEPGTGEQTRTVAIHRAADGSLWPVQTSPITAYGGICPGSPWMDGPSERVALLAAPTDDAPVATRDDQEVGVFELFRSTLTDIEGWSLVGFVQGEVDTGPVKLFCGFHKQ